MLSFFHTVRKYTSLLSARLICRVTERRWVTSARLIWRVTERLWVYGDSFLRNLAPHCTSLLLSFAYFLILSTPAQIQESYLALFPLSAYNLVQWAIGLFLLACLSISLAIVAYEESKSGRAKDSRVHTYLTIGAALLPAAGLVTGIWESRAETSKEIMSYSLGFLPTLKPYFLTDNSISPLVDQLDIFASVDESAGWVRTGILCLVLLSSLGMLAFIISGCHRRIPVRSARFSVTVAAGTLALILIFVSINIGIGEDTLIQAVRSIGVINFTLLFFCLLSLNVVSITMVRNSRGYPVNFCLVAATDDVFLF